MINLATGKQFTRRETCGGLAAIIGAGVAPAIVGTPMAAEAAAGMRRHIGMRTAMMGKIEGGGIGLNYIKSSGTQYINTGIAFNDATIEVSLLMRLDNNLTSSWVDEFFGCALVDGDIGRNLRLRRYDSGNFIDASYRDRPRACPGTGFSALIRNCGWRKIVIRHNYVSLTDVQGNVESSSVTTTNPQTPCNRVMYLFCGNVGNIAFRKATGMSVAKLVITNSSSTLFDGVASNATGSATIYDSISGTHFGNQGSGAFEYGTDATCSLSNFGY